MSAPCFRMLLACGVSLWVIVLCVAYAPCPLPPWWTALCGIRGRISLTIFAFWQHGFNNAHMLPQCRLVSNSKGKRPSMLPSICHWSQGVDTLLHRRSKNSWCLRFTLFEEPLFLSPDFPTSWWCPCSLLICSMKERFPLSLVPEAGFPQFSVDVLSPIQQTANLPSHSYSVALG